MKKLCYIALVCLLFMACANDKKPDGLPQNYMVSKALHADAVDASWSALIKAQTLADAGKGFDEIVNVLPDSAQIIMNKASLLFFVEGSVPMMITKPLKSDKTTKGARSATKQLMPTVSAPLSLADETQASNVIAHERGEENREHKKALIIAGDPEDFGQFDDALVAREYLKGSNNYNKGTIDYLSNKQLSMQSFRNFANYDLVHLSTHGLRYCNKDKFADSNEIEISYGGESEYCRLLIQTGIKHGFNEKEEANDFLNQNPEYAEHIVISKKTFYLKASFFSNFYHSENLKDKIWVFSACELGQRSDFEITIKNLLTNGHFFYWYNSVYAEDSQNAFKIFYKNLVREGLDAKKAFEEIPEEKRKWLKAFLDVHYDSILDTGQILKIKDSIQVTTELLHLQTGEPRHGIEVVQLLHPVGESILQSGDNYPLDGEFGDGQPETLVTKINLLGYTRSEFEAQGMTLSLKVDNHTVLGHFSVLPDDPNDAVSIEKIPKKEYGVRVHFEGLEIPDLSPEKETIELKAYLHFNGENYSVHSEEVNINPKDVKIRANTPNGAVTITYDNDTGGIKYEAPNIPGGHTFSDDSGYMYAHVPREGGWKKLNLNNFMGQNMAQMMGQMMPVSMDVDILMGREGISTETPEMPQGNPVFKPMVDWPEKMTIANLSRSPNFKKRKTNCLSSKGDCVAFTGISGNAKGVQIHFNASGKMQRITIKGHRLDYEYGDYTVILPQAQELKLPF